MYKYDFLIVGAGLFGATFAQIASSRGKTCLVIDKRGHIAGNAYTEDVSGINVHKYGAHIFHTSNRDIWEYVNQFAEFNNYINSPLARYGDDLYNLPFNMNTFYKLWGASTPLQAQEIIKTQRDASGIVTPQNLEEQAIFLAGNDIYQKLIKGYTKKQWGRECKDLPVDIIKRIPLRFTYDNNYFNDRYQGIPIGGYTKMVERMLQGSDVLLDTNYFDFVSKHKSIARYTIYTGPIDEYFNYCFGALDYRSLRFEAEQLSIDNYQGNAVINYTCEKIPHTRIIEHKHFEFGKQPGTIITREFPADWEKGMDPYYPVNDEANNMLYLKYKALASAQRNICFGGRLGQYRYLDMDKTIASAFELVDSIVF